MDKPAPLPVPLPDDLRALLHDMAFWLKKSLNGYQPPEALVDCATWVCLSLSDLAENRQARWPADPWAFAPPPIKEAL